MWHDVTSCCPFYFIYIIQNCIHDVHYRDVELWSVLSYSQLLKRSYHTCHPYPLLQQLNRDESVADLGMGHAICGHSEMEYIIYYDIFILKAIKTTGQRFELLNKYLNSMFFFQNHFWAVFSGQFHRSDAWALHLMAGGRWASLHRRGAIFHAGRL